MPKRDSITSNSYKYGSISVKYRFFLVFSRFPVFLRKYFGFQKTSVFFGLPKNRLTLDHQKFFKNIQKPCQTSPKQLLSINKNMF